MMNPNSPLLLPPSGGCDSGLHDDDCWAQTSSSGSSVDGGCGGSSGPGLPDYIRRAIYGELTLEEKRALLESSMSRARKVRAGSLLTLTDQQEGLLDRLQDARLDDERSYMHQVVAFSSPQSVSALSAVSRGQHAMAAVRLAEVRAVMEEELALLLRDPSSESWSALSSVRLLTIPETLPDRLRPMLGEWLRARGRLAHVTSVRCRSWVRAGEVLGWIDLEAIRAGEPQLMTPEERSSLDVLDPDSLLKTVLQHVLRRPLPPWP